MQFKNRTKAIVIAVALTTLFAGTGFAASQGQAASQAWVTQNIGQLRALLPDKTAVNTLIKRLYGDTVVEPTVGQYELAGLNGDGTVELVVTVDFSGRGFYNTINIVKNDDGDLHTFTIRTNGVNVSDLQSRLVDLNHDGVIELLIPRGLAPYAGATPIPVIDDVYTWNGTQYEKTDARFKNYYRDAVLPRLQSALDALAHGHSSADVQVNWALKIKYQKELDAVNAILSE